MGEECEVCGQALGSNTECIACLKYALKRANDSYMSCKEAIEGWKRTNNDLLNCLDFIKGELVKIPSTSVDQIFSKQEMFNRINEFKYNQRNQ